MHCSVVLVGVRGELLEWLHFLPRHAALLELGWRQNRPGQFRGLAQRRGLVADTLTAGDNATINWARFLRGTGQQVRTLTHLEKNMYLKIVPVASPGPNPLSFGDGHFDVGMFVKKLKGIISRLEENFHMKLA